MRPFGYTPARSRTRYAEAVVGALALVPESLRGGRRDVGRLKELPGYLPDVVWFRSLDMIEIIVLDLRPVAAQVTCPR